MIIKTLRKSILLASLIYIERVVCKISSVNPLVIIENFHQPFGDESQRRPSLRDKYC